MTRLEKLEADVAALSPPDLARFRGWFETFAAESWDAEIDADIRVGKLDTFADAALADFRSNRSRLL